MGLAWVQSGRHAEGLSGWAARQRGVGWVGKLSAVRSFRELGNSEGRALVRQSLRISAHCQRLGIAILAVLGFAVLVIGPGAKPASAAAFAFIQNYQTGLCLASSNGQVYTESCTSGLSDEWEIGVTPSSSPNVAIQSAETGLWLDSNSSGDLYTLPGNGGAYQSWVYLYPNDDGETAFQDVATGRWLDSNYAGDAYTLPGNGGTYQSWSVEPYAP